MITQTNNKIEIEKIEFKGITKKEEKIKERELAYINKSSNAKNFKTWLFSRLQLASLNKDRETEIILKSIYEKFKEFESIGIGKVVGWKGKSGIIECIKCPDKIIIKRMRKFEKGEKPIEVNIEIPKQKLNAMITSLNLNREKQPIETKFLAMSYSKILNLGHSAWDKGFKPFETDRQEHNIITNILCFFESEGLINYSRRGKTIILKDKLDIQMIL